MASFNCSSQVSVLLPQVSVSRNNRAGQCLIYVYIISYAFALVNRVSENFQKVCFEERIFEVLIGEFDKISLILLFRIRKITGLEQLPLA